MLTIFATRSYREDEVVKEESTYLPLLQRSLQTAVERSQISESEMWWKALLFVATLLVGATLGIVAYSLFRDTWEAEFWQFLGALGGAAIAVLGAFAVTQWQFNRQRKLDDNDRNRRLDAALAILAGDLTTICSYSEECGTAIFEAIDIVEGRKAKTIVRCPELDAQVPLRVERLIPLMEPNDATQAADLLHCHQVQRARLSNELRDVNEPIQGPIHRVSHRGNFLLALISTVEFRLRADRMFNYARKRKESIGAPVFDENQLHDALAALRIEDRLNEREWAELDRYFKIDRNPAA